MSAQPSAPYAIAGELSIYQAAELAQALDAWAHACTDNVAQLNLSQVSEMDSAGLQLLLALARTLQGRQQQLHIVQASAAVREVLALCQCTHWLDAPGAVAAAQGVQ